ncbi:MAG: glycosyltransferase [Deltaproteobacteria bacterium]|nr:glycosyltransferase [Deltaproteobacteria bacterium]
MNPKGPSQPTDPTALSRQVVAQALNLAREFRFDAADQLLREHLARNPRDQILLEGAGRLYVERQDFGQAAEMHRRLLELVPDSARLHNALATILTMCDRHDEAEYYLVRAVELDPHNPVFQNNLGKFFLMQQRWSEALPHLEAALAQAPEAGRPQIMEWVTYCRQQIAEAGPAAGFAWEPPAPATTAPPAPEAPPAPQAWSPAPAASPTPEPPPPAAEDTASATIEWLQVSFAAPAEAPAAEPAAPAPLAEPSPAPVAPASPAAAPAPDHRLKILFVQEVPCVRNYKMARALLARGHQVTLAYGRFRPSEVYPGLDDGLYTACVHLTSHRQLWDLAAAFEVVHCHNEPDVWSVVALGCGKPVVHDTHDLLSLREPDDTSLTFFEGLANRAAGGRVYTTVYQEKAARRLYGVQGPSLVLGNYISRDDLPAAPRPKLSAGDGQPHLVYEGHLGHREHRRLSDIFLAIADRGVNVHIYPTKWAQGMAPNLAAHPRVHVHQPVAPHEIIGEMTQYDAGVIPWRLGPENREFLDTTLANKLYEYLAAGLPVVTSPLVSYRDFFSQNPVGFTFREPQEIAERWPELTSLAAETDFSAYVFTYEDQIPRLEQFYYDLLGG